MLGHRLGIYDPNLPLGVVWVRVGRADFAAVRTIGFDVCFSNCASNEHEEISISTFWREYLEAGNAPAALLVLLRGRSGRHKQRNLLSDAIVRPTHTICA